MLAAHEGEVAYELDGVRDEHGRPALRLRVDGASVSYELRANSAFNPFKSRVLSGFSLPERL